MDTHFAAELAKKEQELTDLKARHEITMQDYKDLVVQYNDLLPRYTKFKQELADLKETVQECVFDLENGMGVVKLRAIERLKQAVKEE